MVDCVLGVLLEGDELGHPAGPLEQGDEEDEAEAGPVEDVAGCSDREKVVADPDGLLGGVVRLTDYGIEATLVIAVGVVAIKGLACVLTPRWNDERSELHKRDVLKL